jgi:hypothetical protein
VFYFRKSSRPVVVRGIPSHHFSGSPPCPQRGGAPPLHPIPLLSCLWPPVPRYVSCWPARLSALGYKLQFLCGHALSLLSLQSKRKKPMVACASMCQGGCQLARLHVSSNLRTPENTSLRGRWACMLLPRTPTPSPPHAHPHGGRHIACRHTLDGSWHPLATTLRMLAVGLCSPTLVLRVRQCVP